MDLYLGRRPVYTTKRSLVAFHGANPLELPLPLPPSVYKMDMDMTSSSSSLLSTTTTANATTSLVVPCLLLISSSMLFFMVLHQLVAALLPYSRRTTNTGSRSYGPKMHPVIGSLLAFYSNRHRLLDWYTELLAASPTQTFVVQRLGARRTIVTANPDSVEHILKANFPNYPKGEPFTQLLGDLLGCGIFNVDGDLWHAQRKLASHEFTTRSLREFVVEALDNEAHGRLLPILSGAAASRRPVDVQDLLRRFAFDTICRVSLGTDPGYLDASLPRSEFADAFEVAAAISAMRGTAPVQAVWKVKRALRVGSEKKLRDAVRLIHASIMELIHARKKEMELGMVRDDLLSRLISGGHGDEVIRDMVISFIMAGRDTTSAALTWFFWILSSRPDVEAEVVEEVSRAGGQLDYESLRRMKSLEACLCESMRLYPPVAWDSKHAAADDVLPDGTAVKRGDRVTYFQYGMGRMERIWGKDCLEFDHQRWLTEDGDVVKTSPYRFSVFQAGPRVCLGKEMAFVQMKYIAAAVLGSFELRNAPRSQPAVLLPLLTAHMAGGLPMMVERKKRAGVHGSAMDCVSS